MRVPLMGLSGALQEAFAQKKALCGFNVDSLEMLQGIAEALEKSPLPTFLQVTPETLEIWGWTTWMAMSREVLAPLASPVSLHLDHATRLSDVRRAIETGFTSVMYDGSALPTEENQAHTREVVGWARPKGILVEAEIGHVAKPGESDVVARLTTAREASDFYQATEVDALAVAIGTHHATSIGPDAIDLARLEEIRRALRIPLVLHGSSGVPTEMYSALRERGIAKMNFGTELRRVWWRRIRQEENRKPREVLQAISHDVSDWAVTKMAECIA